MSRNRFFIHLSFFCLLVLTQTVAEASTYDISIFCNDVQITKDDSLKPLLVKADFNYSKNSYEISSEDFLYLMNKKNCEHELTGVYFSFLDLFRTPRKYKIRSTAIFASKSIKGTGNDEDEDEDENMIMIVPIPDPDHPSNIEEDPFAEVMEPIIDRVSDALNGKPSFFQLGLANSRTVTPYSLASLTDPAASEQTKGESDIVRLERIKGMFLPPLYVFFSLNDILDEDPYIQAQNWLKQYSLEKGYDDTDHFFRDSSARVELGRFLCENILGRINYSRGKIHKLIESKGLSFN